MKEQNIKKGFDYEKAIRQWKEGKELVNIIIRLGGTRENYKKLYNMINGY